MSAITRPDDVAFPTSEGSGGMTKREYFAAIILQGMSSNGNVTLAMTFKEIDGPECQRIFAVSAVQQADALIAALNKTHQ